MAWYKRKFESRTPLNTRIATEATCCDESFLLSLSKLLNFVVVVKYRMDEGEVPISRGHVLYSRTFFNARHRAKYEIANTNERIIHTIGTGTNIYYYYYYYVY